MQQQPPAPLPIFPWIAQYTPVIPKLYWDVYSAEERIKWLCVEYDRITHYLTDIAKHINDDDVENEVKFDAIDTHLKALDKITNDLVDAFKQLTANLPTYNPTTGKYENSQKTNRDIYRELAVFGARVNQMAQLTVEEAAATSNLEMAVIGNYTVFNDHAPRVTPVTGNTTPPEPPEPKTAPLTVNDLASGVVQKKYFRKK